MLIKNGLGAVMVAHLNIPSLDDTKDLAVSLSPRVVKGLLKEEMNFKGLVITDALNIQAKQGKVVAYKFKGKRFDCGSVTGYLEANNYYAKNL